MSERTRSGWGVIVRRLREERGWTQAELALRAGVDQSQVSKIEGGSREDAKFSTVGKVADALGVSTDVLRGRAMSGLPVAELADALIERMRGGGGQQAAELGAESQATRKRDSRSLKAHRNPFGELDPAAALVS